MSDTPKTDAAEASALEVGQWHLAKLCRELERENAALRERLDSVQKSHFSLSKDCAALREDKARLDSGMIRVREMDEMGDFYWYTYLGLDLRASIDAARKEAQP